ncbi:RNA-binding domain-containing protein [Autumnicola psychrophila]|uniref:DNA binding domain-containing protein n=1 Tax=Autumnicola psychrophila TaxID=3075592 RepID=A0ABU3DQA3_9FLAO|nr:RNA-binding domain-containing protein [Zunongwangia sp. F225]MDT0685882.1 putative DNA binding domain-containing protein [Zunongwangia sp. F225]
MKLKDHGKYPKENGLVDYKMELNFIPNDNDVTTFMKNFAKDIISFSNANGGIIIIGIKENSTTGVHEDLGLNQKNIDCFAKLDLNDISQKFNKILKNGVSLDIQQFQISIRKFYYILIPKSNNTLVPINDFKEYKIEKGAIYYRDTGGTEQANKSTSEFDRFLQIKANEKSKEFMEIWSKLLPEMIDINPREVLILNPQQNKVYGFNNKDKTLSGSNIDIEKSQEGVFNIILSAISAGEIGKITDNEGKPIYKLMGEIHTEREHISLTSLEKAVKEVANYKFTNAHLKIVIDHLGWVNDKSFNVINPPNQTVSNDFNKFIWIETVDQYSQRTKVFFSPSAIPEIAKVIDDPKIHKQLFNKKLSKK